MRDWPGLWFKILEERGDFSTGRFARAKNLNELEWKIIPHWQVDGIGGVLTILREAGFDPPVPKLHPKLMPTWYGKFLGLFHYLRFIPVHSGRWRRLDAKKTSQKETYAYHIFSVAETARLKTHTSEAKISFHNLLLWSLTEAMRPELIAGSGPFYWMIPVNLRGAVKNISDTANHSSCVWIDTQSPQTVDSVQKQMLARFRENFHWGAWIMTHIGRIIGVSGMKKILNHLEKIDDHWIGSFANLGIWDVTPEPWIGVAPVTRGLPFAATVVTSANQLSLSVQTHSALCDDPELLQTWMNAWIKTLFSVLPIHPSDPSA